MSTWGTFLADLRTDLKDTGATPKWSDDTLYLFAKDAIRAYSVDLPMVVIRHSLVADVGAFALPTNFLAVIAVERQTGVYLDRYEPRPGKQVRLPSVATAYYFSGVSIYLNVAPVDDDVIYLSYHAFHDLPTSKDDTTKVLTVPASDEEIVRLFVKAKVSEQMRMNQSSLDRFKQGSGSRDDNPLLPEHNELMEEYRMRISQRLGGVIPINRGGRY